MERGEMHSDDMRNDEMQKDEMDNELTDFEENMRREIEAYMNPAQQRERANATQSPEQFAEQFAAYQENAGKQAESNGALGQGNEGNGVDESTVAANGLAADAPPASPPATKPRRKKATKPSTKQAYAGTAYRTGHLVKLAVRTKPLSMDIVFEHVSSSISKLEAQLEAEKAARKAGYPIIGYVIETTPLKNG